MSDSDYISRDNRAHTPEGALDADVCKHDRLPWYCADCLWSSHAALDDVARQLAEVLQRIDQDWGMSAATWREVGAALNRYTAILDQGGK